jgi:hypothetical protein
MRAVLGEEKNGVNGGPRENRLLKRHNGHRSESPKQKLADGSRIVDVQ